MRGSAKMEGMGKRGQERWKQCDDRDREDREGMRRRGAVKTAGIGRKGTGRMGRM